MHFNFFLLLFKCCFSLLTVACVVFLLDSTALEHNIGNEYFLKEIKVGCVSIVELPGCCLIVQGESTQFLGYCRAFGWGPLIRRVSNRQEAE